MKANILTVNGKEYTLTEEQAKAILKDFNLDKSKLADIAVAKTCNIGNYEFIVLEHLENGETVLILKDLLADDENFGSNNNYNGSNVDKICNEFAQKLEALIGAENLCMHTVDLTSANGMTCYGKIERKVSLLTLENLSKYGNILCDYKLNNWCWLSTAMGTEKWGNKNWVACVSPSGVIDNVNCDDNVGVRPFCIVKSNIFVSK